MNIILPVLQSAANAGVSDLFLSAGKKPSARTCGVVSHLGSFGTIPAESIDAFRRTVIGERGEAAYAVSGAFDASWQVPGGGRIRVNFFRAICGPSAAVRPVRNGDDVTTSALNLPALLDKLAEAPRGLILVAGTTGCGKSTTLAAMISHINRTMHKHILTLEDPIEFVYSDRESLISQREIDTAREGGFSSALRSALRENPDVIVIGEMRDPETIATAINAALTGHLVISTVHTSGSVQAVERIVNMFPEDAREQTAIDLGAALNGIVSQRLIPALGSASMLPAVEILLGTALVRKLVAGRDYKSLDDALRSNTEQGMIPFNRSIFRLYQTGKIALPDALDAADNRDEFNLLVKGMESGVDAFRSYYGSKLDGAPDDETVVDMRTLFLASLQVKASDLILSTGVRPTLRINGELRELNMPVLDNDDVRRLLFSVINQRQRVELEENRELDFALSVDFGKELNVPNSRFRVNAFFQRGSLGMVARVVNVKIPSPAQLGLPEVVSGLCGKRQGLVLVTGPTGSGKSTTLASLLDVINRTRNAHIITIEDPIEYVHRNINSIIEQRELHADTHSFSAALKYALREAPDVIMVGEMRDTETMSAALTAAETGHLVFATIHTNSAPQTVDRIVDSFPMYQQNQIRLQLAATLLAVISQRLIPSVDGSSRLAAFEIMIGTPPVQALIREGKTHQLRTVIETSLKDGMCTLDRSMQDLADDGLISPDELKRFTADYKQIDSH
jgi:twitching motility protein PilT